LLILQQKFIVMRKKEKYSFVHGNTFIFYVTHGKVEMR